MENYVIKVSDWKLNANVKLSLWLISVLWRHIKGTWSSIFLNLGMKQRWVVRFTLVGFTQGIWVPADWLWWGETVSELQPPVGLLFIPRVICEHGEPWWRCWLGITPDLSTRALWQSYQQRHLGQVGGMDEGVRILPIRIWNTSRDL
jgi:hypothetical protein